MLTFESFYKHLRTTTQANSFCIAFSGGLDSRVLLDLFVKVREIDPAISLRCVHINHGLSPNAKTWENFCAGVCADFQIPLSIYCLNLQKNKKESLEEVARVKRYEIFKQTLLSQEVLVTAHHQNDQAETLLLQLFRGAGPKGLASMPHYCSFGEGLLIRPLLPFDRASLMGYAQNQAIKWLDDESNAYLRFDRNFLRHSVLPVIESRWPGIIKNLSRAAEHSAAANRFIEHQVADLFIKVFDPVNSTLNIPELLKFEGQLQNYILRYWLQHLKYQLPSTQKLHILRHEILFAKKDSVPLLCWKNVEVRRYRDRLYVMKPLLEHCAQMVIHWDLKKDLALPNQLGSVRLQDLERLGIDSKNLQNATIRFRKGGETCRLPNRKNNHCLKKLFQSWGVPPWNRDRVPLLYENDKIKAVIGFSACE